MLRVLRFHLAILNSVEEMAVGDSDEARRNFVDVNLAYQRKFTARLIARFSV